jgi:hypothetical protein
VLADALLKGDKSTITNILWRGAKETAEFCRFLEVFRGSLLVLHVTGMEV